MSRIQCRIVFVCLAILLFCPGPAGSTPPLCATEGPQSVLTCIEKAYQARDLKIIEDVLAPDFVFVAGPKMRSKDRAWELMAYGKLLNDTTVTNLSLQITGPRRAVPGDTAGTWILDSLVFATGFDSRRDGEPRRYDVTSSGNRISVRLVAKPEPHFQIFHWFQPNAKK